MNVILSQDEKRGGSLVRDPIREIVDEISMEWDLMDVNPTAGKYTWNNRRIGPGHIVSRLDRFLIHDTFLLMGLKLTTKILPFGGSDHKPILLEMVKDMNLGPILLLFQVYFLEDGLTSMRSHSRMISSTISLMGSLTKEPPLFSSWLRMTLRSPATITLPYMLLFSLRRRLQQTFFLA